MKNVSYLLGAGVASLLVGCASPPVSLGPIGPNPMGSKSQAATGELQVLSRVVDQQDDQEQGGDGMPVWYGHTDYNVYDLQGKLVKHVFNTTGHYAEDPSRVTLPAGTYLVKAQAKDYLRVQVPVIIVPGRTTRVHLDDNWRPSADAPKNAVVTEPDGNPVGWLANSR